jgi:hypothetical protein
LAPLGSVTRPVTLPFPPPPWPNARVLKIQRHKAANSNPRQIFLMITLPLVEALDPVDATIGACRLPGNQLFYGSPAA